MVGGERTGFRVINALSETPRDAFTILGVAHLVKISYPAAKQALYRLAKAGKIARVRPGLYQHPSGLVVLGAPDPRLRIHALKLEARTVTKWGDGASRHLSRMVTTVFPQIEGGIHRHPNNGSLTVKGEWNNRLLTVTAHPRHESGLLEVFLEASLRPLHLLEVHSYLTGFIPAKFDLPLELWEVRQADWNIDVPGTVKTDLDFTGMSVAAFEKFILKIYQKAEELVRAEIRSFEPIMVEHLVDYLGSILNTLAEVS